MPHRRAMILVIDDDEAMRTLIHEALRDEGYGAVTLATHAEAIGALRAFRFTLILADPSGATPEARWASLAAVHDAAGDTPVVIFSAHAPATFAGYAERGFAGLLSKPFDLDELTALVTTLLTDPVG